MGVPLSKSKKLGFSTMKTGTWWTITMESMEPKKVSCFGTKSKLWQWRPCFERNTTLKFFVYALNGWSLIAWWNHTEKDGDQSVQPTRCPKPISAQWIIIMFSIWNNGNLDPVSGETPMNPSWKPMGFHGAQLRLHHDRLLESSRGIPAETFCPGSGDGKGLVVYNRKDMDVGQNGRPMWDHRCECLV